MENCHAWKRVLFLQEIYKVVIKWKCFPELNKGGKESEMQTNDRQITELMKAVDTGSAQLGFPAWMGLG